MDYSKRFLGQFPQEIPYFPWPVMVIQNRVYAVDPEEFYNFSDWAGTTQIQTIFP